MIISDLQHIESATETEVQGGGDRWRPYYSKYVPKAEGGFDDFLPTDTIVIQNKNQVIFEKLVGSK